MDETTNTSLEEALLPDGYEEGGETALFREADPFAAEAAEAAEGESAPQEPPESAKETPEAAEASQDTPEAETPPEDGQGAPDVDYRAFYEHEMERRAADQYRAVYEAQKDAGMTDELAAIAARAAAGGKDYPLTDQPQDAPQRDFAADIQALHEAYPDAKEMPAEVMAAYNAGGDLVRAYGAYQAKQDGATIAQLRKEIAELKAARDTAARAPVTSVTAGTPAQNGETDPFLRGFDLG